MNMYQIFLIIWLNSNGSIHTKVHSNVASACGNLQRRTGGKVYRLNVIPIEESEYPTKGMLHKIIEVKCKYIQPEPRIIPGYWAGEIK